MVSAVTTVALLLATNTTGAASNLSTAAAQMAPGSFVELTGMTGWNNGAPLEPCGNTTANILEFANTAVWNPIGKRFQFSGSPHTCTGPNERAIYYDDATNTWGTLPSPNPSAVDPRHSYGHNAMDPATGNHYYTNYNSTDNLRLANGAGSWTSLAPWPTAIQCCRSQAFFPDRNSLIRVDGNWGVWEYSVASNSWTQRGQGNATDGSGRPQVLAGGTDQPTWSLYSARCHCVIFGAGTPFMKYNSDGSFTTLNKSGGPSGIQCCTREGSSGASVVVDPVSGSLIVIGQPNTLRAFDPGTTPAATGSWSTPGVTPPAFFASGAGVYESLISAPVSTYGVIMYVKHDDSSTGRVFLYKHAPSAPQTTPGVPRNVSAQ